MPSIVLNMAQGSTSFNDPLTKLNAGISHITGFVNVTALPLGIPNDPNARAANTKARNAKAIRESLKLNDGKFHLKNKGITILASSMKLVGQDTYSIDLLPGIDGIVDGGHTYGVVSEEVSNGAVVGNQHVPVFVRVGCPPTDLAAICEGLNTSMQVSPSSLMNKGGLYAWMESAVSNGAIPAQVKWMQNDTGVIGVEELVKIAAVVTPGAFPNGHPVMAYSSKTALLSRYRAFQPEFAKTSSIVCDALALYDIIATELPVVFKRAKHTDDRLFNGKVYRSHLFSRRVPIGVARVPAAIALPVTAGLRAWVIADASGDYVWDRTFVDVEADMRNLFPDVVAITSSAWTKHGGNPNDLGKDTMYWADIYNLFAKNSLGTSRQPRFEADSPESQGFRGAFTAELEKLKKSLADAKAGPHTDDARMAIAAQEYRIEQVEELLEALSNGAFGYCVVCGVEVESYRLDAVSTATKCQGCAFDGR